MLQPSEQSVLSDILNGFVFMQEVMAKGKKKRKIFSFKRLFKLALFFTLCYIVYDIYKHKSYEGTVPTYHGSLENSRIIEFHFPDLFSDNSKLFIKSQFRILKQVTINSIYRQTKKWPAKCSKLGFIGAFNYTLSTKPSFIYKCSCFNELLALQWYVDK